MRALEPPKQDRLPVSSSAREKTSSLPKADRSSAPAAPERSPESEGKNVDKPLVASTAVTKGLFDRVLRGLLASPGQAQEEKSKLPPMVPRARSEADAGAPNDLRSYLQRRAALQNRDLAKDARHRETATSRGKGPVGPVLKSLDAVLNHVRARSAGNTPRVVLAAPVSTDVDATDEAIRIARALVSGKQRAVLVDLTRGAAAVSGRLGLPRAPGFTDLAAGRADFEHVVHIDKETPLQVIPAGNPTVKADGDDTDRATRIFEALTQAYDCIVLHADHETARKLEPALDGRLQVVVAVLAPGESAKAGEKGLAELTAFGCPVVPYEQTDEERRLGRSGLLAAPRRSDAFTLSARRRGQGGS